MGLTETLKFTQKEEQLFVSCTETAVLASTFSGQGRNLFYRFVTSLLVLLQGNDSEFDFCSILCLEIHSHISVWYILQRTLTSSQKNTSTKVEFSLKELCHSKFVSQKATTGFIVIVMYTQSHSAGINMKHKLRTSC